MKSKILFHSILIICFLSTLKTEAKTIYYVKQDATGDGSSWSKAAGNIQSMIDKAISGDEVWVAKGTYYPTTESVARDARSRTLLLKDGINVYGGFEGTETTISQRVLADLDNNGKVDSCELVNKTLLSGDIDGVTDIWTKTINSDGKTWKWVVSGNENNSYHVITYLSPYSSIWIYFDGFSIMGGNANLDSFGGGIYTDSRAIVKNCMVSYCSASNSGGGIYGYYVENCVVSNCAAYRGGGISSGHSSNCVVSNCSAFEGGGIYTESTNLGYAKRCTINDCSADSEGGGIFLKSYGMAASYFVSSIGCVINNCSAGNNGGGIIFRASNHGSGSALNCLVTNCYAVNNGGGISSYGENDEYYIFNSTHCIVSNCYAGQLGGGILNSSATNCIIYNCSASVGGGYYCRDYNNIPIINSIVTNCYGKNIGGVAINYRTALNCAISNNMQEGDIISNINNSAIQKKIITPEIQTAYVRPTSFIGLATTSAQQAELLTADWHLGEGSACIDAGDSTYLSASVLDGTDYDGNPRVRYGNVDIGVFEYSVPTISLPGSENFSNWSDFEKSELFYRSAKLNTLNDIKWTIVNGKAEFSWQTNLVFEYTQPIFTYQIDATNASKVYLSYEMYFQAYSGTINPLGTEKLYIEFSTDLVSWSTIATYSNLNGTIANTNYNHDISSLAAGKNFFIRFSANGVNSNRIEKWEIDNVSIRSDITTDLKPVSESKYNYSINNGVLAISNLGQATNVEVYDISGKHINSSRGTHSQTMYFSLPAHGVYLIKVSTHTGFESKKVVW